MTRSEKAILLIGGGELQIPTLERARKLGFLVVASDQNSNCPGRGRVDWFEAISGTDIESLTRLADEIDLQHGLAGVFASADFALPAVAAITERFGLPGASRKTVRSCLDKKTCKGILKKAGITTPEGWSLEDDADPSSIQKELPEMVIVKPAASSGSRGVRSAQRDHDLAVAIREARRFGSRVIIEPLLQGRHVDVNACMIEGELLPCGMLDREFSATPYHYPVRGCQPSRLTAEQQEEVYSLLARAAYALGLENGPLKADLIWTQTGPVFLEITPRFHGDVSTSFVTPLVYGVSPVELWLSYLKYRKRGLIHFPPSPIGQFAGWQALFPQHEGVFQGIRGETRVRTRPGITDIRMTVDAGSTLRSAKDNSNVCGFIWGVGRSRQEVYDRLEAARKEIHLLVEPGPASVISEKDHV